MKANLLRLYTFMTSLMVLVHVSGWAEGTNFEHTSILSLSGQHSFKINDHPVIAEVSFDSELEKHKYCFIGNLEPSLKDSILFSSDKSKMGQSTVKISEFNHSLINGLQVGINAWVENGSQPCFVVLTKQESRKQKKQRYDQEEIAELAKAEGGIALLALTKPFSSNCETKKVSHNPNVFCQCKANFTLDYNSCEAYLKAYNTNIVGNSQLQEGHKTSLGIHTNNTLKKQNENPDQDQTLLGYKANIDSIAISGSAQSAKFALTQKTISSFKNLQMNWPRYDNKELFLEKCKLANNELMLGGKEVNCEEILKSELRPEHFTNFPILYGLDNQIAGLQKEKSGTLNSLYELTKGMISNVSARKHYENRIQEEEGLPVSCLADPTQAGCAGVEDTEPTAQQDPYAQRGMSISGGAIAAYDLDSEAGGDLGFDQGTGTYNQKNTPKGFIGDAPQAHQAKPGQRAAGAAGGSGGGGVRAQGGGGGAATPKSRSAKMKKQPMKVGKVNGYARKKRKGQRGFRRLASARGKRKSAVNKNPFDALFKKPNQTRKQANAALSKDGVRMKSKKTTGTSLFKRISRVHRRKLEKRKLLVY